MFIELYINGQWQLIALNSIKRIAPDLEYDPEDEGQSEGVILWFENKAEDNELPFKGTEAFGYSYDELRKALQSQGLLMTKRDTF